MSAVCSRRCNLNSRSSRPCFRTPDDAPIRQKMVYASSKDALRKQLVGIAAEIQATSYDEITYDAGELTLKSCYLWMRTERSASLHCSPRQVHSSLKGDFQESCGRATEVLVVEEQRGASCGHCCMTSVCCTPPI